MVGCFRQTCSGIVFYKRLREAHTHISTHLEFTPTLKYSLWISAIRLSALPASPAQRQQNERDYSFCKLNWNER